MNFLLRIAIIALLALIGALVFIMLLCVISDPTHQEIRNLFVLVFVCVGAALVPKK